MFWAGCILVLKFWTIHVCTFFVFLFWNSEKNTLLYDLFFVVGFATPERKDAAGPKWNFQKTQFCFILHWKINNFINKCIQNQRVPPWTVSWNLLPGYKLNKKSLLLYFTNENQSFYQKMHPNSKGPPLGRFPKFAFQRSKLIVFLINSSFGALELPGSDWSVPLRSLLRKWSIWTSGKQSSGNGPRGDRLNLAALFDKSIDFQP